MFLISLNSTVIAQTVEQEQKPKGKPYFVHEFSAYAMGGLSNIGYKLDGGSRDNGFGGSAGMSYAYSTSDKFAIVTGAEFNIYSSKLRLDGFIDEYSAIDDNGDLFSLQCVFEENYSEQQRVILFTIPVLARYTMPLNRSIKYFAAGGLKLGLPFIARATITPGTVSTSGFYEYEARRYTNLLEHGFVNGQPGDRTTSNIRIGIAPMISLETGIRFSTGFKTALTAAVYLDHSLVNIQKSNDKHILEYQSLQPMNFIYNSVLNTAKVNKVRLFSTGLKIGLIF
jgi:hypothetical protein